LEFFFGAEEVMDEKNITDKPVAIFFKVQLKSWVSVECFILYHSSYVQRVVRLNSQEKKRENKGKGRREDCKSVGNHALNERQRARNERERGRRIKLRMRERW
jgi:hypothetical protein